MTIGIGILCEEGNCIVLASDTRVSYPNSRVRPHEESGKQWDLLPPFKGGVAIAGNVSTCQLIVDELDIQFRRVGKQKNIYNEHIEVRFSTYFVLTTCDSTDSLSAILYRALGRPSGTSTLCAMCTRHCRAELHSWRPLRDGFR